MADEIQVEYDDGDFKEFLRRFGPLLYENVRTGIVVASAVHERKLKLYHRAVPAGGFIARKPANSPLSTITGTLLGPGSQGVEIRGNRIENLVGIRYIGRGVPYALIHELGGTIRPRRAKVLTIPTRFHRTQAGDFRGRAIHFEGYWRKSKSGRLWFISSETGQPLFLGVTRVEIPPRLRFVAMWDDDKPLHEKIFARGVREAAEGKRYAPGQ